MTDRKKIAYDLDGVVYDFMFSFDQEMKSLGFSVDESSYNLGKRYGTTNKVGLEHLNNLRGRRLFHWIPLFHEARELMINDSKDNDIYVITSRDPSCGGRSDTLDRISHDKLPVLRGNVLFRENKGKVAEQLGIDLFYEDCLKNAYDIIDRSYSDVIIVDAPYNRTNDKRLGRIKWERR